MARQSYDPARARTKYAVPIWADAFLRDTMGLDATDIGAWHLLIYAMWANRDLRLPNKDKPLATICRVSRTIWVRRLRPTLEPLFIVDETCWRSHRLEKEARKTEAFLLRQHMRALGQVPDQEEMDFEPTQLVPQDEAGQDTFRGRLLAAAGVDPVSGLTGRGGSRLGDEAQMIEARRWISDLDLSESQVLDAIRNVMRGKRGGPPKTLTYFTPVMERCAGDLRAAQTKTMEAQDVPPRTRENPSGTTGRAGGSGLASLVARRQLEP
ncbi:DUF1376 domain-containing protein [Sagittula salina]|uniref:DUF1376 domain-containing protein n=1 Tax=Sagittula salina TaxID=2820268 RepID=A0A940S317_9RHOB|nr:DUF1376 domain-containing protein [Sagittula salina]